MLGTMIGGFISRHTELEKWRRSNIGPSIEVLLKLLSKARIETTNIIYDEKLEEPHRGIRITLAYMPALDQVNVVRLFMREEKRERLSSLVSEVHHLHSQVEIGQTRLQTMENKITEIQNILEKETANKANPLERIFHSLCSRKFRR